MTSRCILTGLIMMGLLFAGCSSTSISGSWKSPDYTEKLKTVYIVGISKNETTRRIFEDGFRSSFDTFGVAGISSYKDLQITAETQQAIIKERANANGADTLLLARAVGKRTEEVVNPGRITAYDYGPGYFGRRGYYPRPYYRNYGSYYSRSLEMTYEPATITHFEIVTIEANLFDARTDALIWSAQLETIVENNMEKLISDFIETVIKDLDAEGLL